MLSLLSPVGDYGLSDPLHLTDRAKPLRKDSLARTQMAGMANDSRGRCGSQCYRAGERIDAAADTPSKKGIQIDISTACRLLRRERFHFVSHLNT